MIQFLSRFLYVLQGSHRGLALMTLLFLLVSFLETLGTGMVGPFISLATAPDTIQKTAWLNWIYSYCGFQSQNQMLWLIGGLVILTFYIKAFLSFHAQKYIFQFSFNQQGNLSHKLLGSYLSAPYTFHLTKNSAELIQNIINETERFANGLMMPLLTSVSNFVVIIALMSLLISTNIVATITIAGVLLIALLIYHYLKNKLSHWGKEVSESRTEMIRLINHSLGGFKETKIIGCEAYFEEQLQFQAQRYANSVSLAISYSNLPRYTIEAFLITFLIIFTFIFISFQKGNAQSLSSVLGVFALASIRLLPAVGNLLSSINGIKYHTHSLDKLYTDLKEIESFDPSGLSIRRPQPTAALDSSPRLQQQVLLKHVSYTYPNTSRKALTDISLELRKGESIGLIGKSGAGKTSLVDVLLGLLKPQTGDIQVDGVSIYQDLRSWQDLIGYVPQSIFLTDDTLERNIAFGVPDNEIDSERLWQAIHTAQLEELVHQLPNGIHTMMGERGVLLSGGQRQRVGIARAIYHEREILVFDEATAALDHETEALVTEAIRSLSGSKTMIIIAHRLSTIEHCHQIYMLEQGRIVKSGSYQEVVLNQSTVS